MPICLRLSNGRLLTFKQGLPADYSGPKLMGASSLHRYSKSMRLVIQQYVGDGFSIRVTLAKFFKGLTLHGDLKYSGLYCSVALKGEMHKRIDSIGPVPLTKDKYSVFHANPTTCSGTFEKNVEHTQVSFYYSPRLLKQIESFNPNISLQEQFDFTLIKFGQTLWCPKQLKDSINQILHYDQNETLFQLYFELKVREILFILVNNSLETKTSSPKISSSEHEKLLRAHRILDSCATGRPTTIRELSKQISLNPFKLKTGFKQLFDSGIFEFILDKKMQHARWLLLNTDKPVKEICRLVGYSRTTNFITAFRKKFGITPGALRRK